MEFRLWVRRAGGRVWAYTRLSDEVRAALDGVTEERFEMRPVCHRNEQEVARLVLVRDEMTGFRADDTLRPAATICGYLRGWSLEDEAGPVPITMGAVAERVHPVIVGAVVGEILRIVFPSSADDADFMALLSGKPAVSGATD